LAKASFPGSPSYGPSFATSDFQLNRQPTSLEIAPTLVYVKTNATTGIIASLFDGHGNYIPERTVLFVVKENGTSIYARAVITNIKGQAPLGALPLGAGNYDVTVYFGGVVPLPGGQSVTVDDGRYVASDTVGKITVTLVLDDTPPEITCPADIVVGTDSGVCEAVVTFAPTATDDKGVFMVVCEPPSGTNFAKGTTEVTCTVTDAAGYTASCKFNVTVEDRTAPDVTVPADIIVNNSPGFGTSNVTFTVTASDNCGVAELVSTPASGSAFPVGTTTVISVATDTAGLKTTKTFNVTVTDTEDPQITCPGTIASNTDPNLASAVVTFPVTATDNTPGVTVVCLPASGTAFPIGTTTVNCTATDTSGRTATCSFQVVISDAQAPVITCPPDITVYTAGTSATVDFTVNATDNSGVPPTVVSSPASGSSFPIGTTAVTSTATDAAGNTSTCSFTVTVVDNVAPTITCPADITVFALSGAPGAVVNYTVTATDNLGVTSLVCTPASGSTFTSGTTTVVECVARDAAGNAATCSFTVTVIPSTVPITASPDVLHPPNHKMISITLTVNYAGIAPLATARVVQVTSNEPINGTGDGDQSPDWYFTGTDLTLQLRAERMRNGTGRIYTITVEIVDALGGKHYGTTTVFVPQ
jgi:hypothetical protein